MNLERAGAVVASTVGFQPEYNPRIPEEEDEEESESGWQGAEKLD